MGRYLDNFEAGILRFRCCWEHKVAKVSCRSWLVRRCLVQVDHLGEERIRHPHLRHCIEVVVVAAAAGSIAEDLTVGMTEVEQWAVGSFHTVLLVALVQEHHFVVDRSCRSFVVDHNFDHLHLRSDRLGSMPVRSSSSDCALSM